MPKNALMSLACLLSTALLLTGCGEESETTATASEEQVEDAKPEPAQTNAPAPPEDWTLPTLDADGLIALKQQAAADGQVLVIDCWATWCEPCKELFPLIHDALADRQGVMLVSIATDEDRSETDNYTELAQNYLIAQHAWEDAYIAIGGEARDAFGAVLQDQWNGAQVPAFFVFGADGQPVYTSVTEGLEAEAQLERVTAAVDAALQ